MEFSPAKLDGIRQSAEWIKKTLRFSFFANWKWKARNTFGDTMGIYVAMSLESKKSGMKFERRIEAINWKLQLALILSQKLFWNDLKMKQIFIFLFSLAAVFPFCLSVGFWAICCKFSKLFEWLLLRDFDEFLRVFLQVHDAQLQPFRTSTVRVWKARSLKLSKTLKVSIITRFSGSKIFLSSTN